MRTDASLTLRAFAKPSIQNVLRVLLAHGGDLPVKDIAERTKSMNRDQVTAALREAAEMDLVTVRVEYTAGVTGRGPMNHYAASAAAIAGLIEWIDDFVVTATTPVAVAEPVEEITPEVVATPTKLSLWDRITLWLYKFF